MSSDNNNNAKTASLFRYTELVTQEMINYNKMNAIVKRYPLDRIKMVLKHEKEDGYIEYTMKGYSGQHIINFIVKLRKITSFENSYSLTSLDWSDHLTSSIIYLDISKGIKDEEITQ